MNSKDKAKLAAKWIKALESGRYRQTEGQLTVKDDSKHLKHCCLGVACDVYQKEVGDLVVERSGYSIVYDENEAELPTKVMNAMGMQDPSGAFNKGATSLAKENDDGKSFKEIVGIIKERANEIFTPSVAREIRKLI